MKLKRVEAFELSVRLKKLVRCSPEFGVTDWDAKPRTVIRAETDDGVVGWGEINAVCEDDLRQQLRELKGHDLLKTSLNRLPCRHDDLFEMWGYKSHKQDRAHEVQFEGVGQVNAAIECALVDIIGKATKRPAHQLFGGKWRDRIPLDFWGDRRTPRDIKPLIEAALRLGFTGIKLKSHVEDDPVGIVKAINRIAGPEFSIVLDPMGRYYRPAEAIRICRGLEKLPNPIILEDPFRRGGRFEWYRQLRAKTDVSIAMHLHNQEDVVRAHHEESCDYINLGVHGVNAIAVGAVATACGFPCWQGSTLECGINAAYAIHISSVIRCCTLHGDQTGPWVREESLLAEPLRLEKGAVIVPDAPGLGIKVDEKRVRKLAKRKCEIAV